MDELDFIVGLMRENYSALGFIPAPRVTEYVQRGRYLLLPRKGYLLHGKPEAFRPLAITQACIEYDLRENGHGRQLVMSLKERGESAYASGLSLRCAATLEANTFWSAMGFKCLATVSPDNTRKRDINIWWLPLIPTLFDGE